MGHETFVVYNAKALKLSNGVLFVERATPPTSLAVAWSSRTTYNYTFDFAVKTGDKTCWIYVSDKNVFPTLIVFVR